MGVKERYEQRQKEGKTSEYSGVKQRYIAKGLDDVASNITNRVNTWLKNHNTYISNYQKRNSGRKYDYSDSYVSDSADWLSTVSQQKSNFDAEAESILSYMDQYKGYLNAEWMDNVRKTLTGARSVQSQIVDNSTKDNQWWSGFGSEELVNAYGSAEDAYKYYQRDDGYRKKYSGQKHDDIQKALSMLEDGEEKSWLERNQYEFYKNDTTYNSKAMSGLKSYEAQKIAVQEKKKEEALPWWQQAILAGFTGDNQFVSGIATAQNAYRNDTSYMEPNEKWSEEQKRHFGYLWTESPAKAHQYAVQVNNQINAMAKYDQQQAVGAWASQNFGTGVLGTLGAIATAPFGMADFLDDIVEYSARGTITQKGALSPFEFGQSAQSGVANKLNEIGGTVDDGVFLFGGKGWGDVYSLGVSAANSLVSAYTLGGVGTLVNFIGQGGASGVDDALSRGATAEQALLYGSIVGAAEGATEMLGADKLIKVGSSATLKNYLMKALSQGIGESVEEGASSVMGNIADAIIMQDKSNLNAAIKEYMSKGLSKEEATKKAWLDMVGDIVFDAMGGFLTGSTNAMTVGGVSTAVDAMKGNQKNIDAVNQYGKRTDALIQEGLQNDVKSDSYQLATKYQKQTKGGKALTGFQIRNLLAANQDQITPNDLKKIQAAAEKRLTELGQTEDVSKLAELATRYATGQELTKEEKSFLANSENGSKVSKQLLPENIEAKYAAMEWAVANAGENADYSAEDISEEYDTDWAEEIGTRSVNFEAYNKKKILVREILDEIMNPEDPNAYKSLGSRMEDEEPAKVSDTGKTVIRSSGKEVDLSNPNIKEITKDGVILEVDGELVNSNDIDYANEDQWYAMKAISKIEHITPAVASAMIAKVDMAKPVGQQLNGMDEAFTYGFYNYSEADLKAGNFTGSLTEDQLNDAYKLGQYVRGKSDVDSDAPVVKMRTEAEAKLSEEQKLAKQKAQIESDDVEVYFQDGKTVTKFDEHTGKYDKKRMAAVNTAKFLAKLKIGGKYYFFESYVNEAGERVYKDADGNEVEAPNGLYESADGSIHVDLNAGDYGQGVALFTLGHELTHFVKDRSKKQFAILSDLVKEAFDKTDMSMHERVLAKQKFLSDKRGKSVSYAEAHEEVIADAMSTMISDGSFHEKLMEIRVKDKGLFDTIKRFFKKMIAKFTEVYAKLTPDQKDAQDIRQMKDMFDKIQTAFAEALVEASDNFRASEQVLAQAGISVNAETDSGSLQSVRDVLNETDRNKVAKALAERFGVTVQEAKNWLKAETSLASLILNPKYSSYLDYEADPNEVAIKQNSDYPQGTVDFSNICKKRREFTQVMNRILRIFPNHVFAATDLAKIRTIMGEEGMTLPCGICYVEDRRQLDSIVAQDFIDGLKLYRDGSKTRPDGKPFNTNQLKGLQLTDGDTYVPSIYELITLEGRNSLKEKNPNMEAAWVKYNNARGMQAVRLLTNEAEYKRQILKYNKSTVKSKNDYGGLRIYSFSDAEMFHLIDIVQVLTDCATVGLKVQGYTKVNEYAKAVKDTGEKLNRSLIPKGDLGYHMENGKVVLDYDPVEGIDINSEDFFDSKDNPNVGNIVIGINPTQIRAAMVSDFIDYIIPFHTGQSAEVLGEKGIAAWDNYKDYQTEKDIETGKTSSHQVNIYTEVFQAAEEEGKPIQNKRQFVEKFLQVCKENGLQPRFSQFLNTDANGDYIYTEGYHKFLVDFKTFAQTEVGEYLPQMPVKPIFDDGYITGLLENYVTEQQAKDAEVAKQMPKVIERITNEIVMPSETGTKSSERDADRQHMNAVDNVDMTTDGEVKYALRGDYWYPKMLKRELREIEDIAKNEVYKTKNYLGIGTKWLYNNQKGHEYFALYSTNNAKDPTILYACKDNQADYEYQWLMEEISKGGLLDGNTNTGARSVVGLLDSIRDAVNRQAVHTSGSGRSGSNSGNATVHSRNRRNRLSAAFKSCLKNIYETQERASLDELYQFAVDIEDYATAQLMVNEAAKTAGYTEDGNSGFVLLDGDGIERSIKSADPVTYDDDGNVIPLSERFDAEKDDIRYSERASNKELAGMDDTALYIKNTEKANYIDMIFNGAKTEETRSRRTLDAFIGKDFYVTDGKYVYGSIVLGEPHKYTDEEFHQKKNQLKHRVPVGDEYDIKPGGTKWAYPIESYKKFDKPKKMSDSTEYKNSFQARQVLYSPINEDADTDPFPWDDTAVEDTEINDIYSYAERGELENFKGEYKADPRELMFIHMKNELAKENKRKAEEIARQEKRKAYDQGLKDVSYASTYNSDVMKAVSDFRDAWKEFSGDDITELTSLYGGLSDETIENFDRIFMYRTFRMFSHQYNHRADKELVKDTNEYNKLGKLFDYARHRVESFYDGLSQEQKTAAYWHSVNGREGKNKISYSERGNGTSNRDLLANAFEGITNGSDEYKLIQRYKGYIAELNSLENKLSEFNRQIREIRFGKGKYDAEKLKKLESEAEKIAGAISKYDQYLLSLEASAPLRKVIDRERKKEAQKTKDHVKEIQQNKKVRAEQTELRHKIRKAIRDLDKILNRGNKKLNVKEDMQGVVSKALKAADILFTENYGSYDMLRNGIGTDMSDAEEALVATCTRMLKDLDKMPTDGYENWQARQEAENRLRTKMSKLKEVFARERKRLNNTTVSSILGELADAYASMEDSEQSYVQGAYSEAVHNFLKNLQSEVGGTIVNDMTKDQLEYVYQAYKMVLETVRNANKMFNQELKMSREQLANAVIEEVTKAGGTHGLWTKAEIAKNRADWNNMKPIWVANRIGSDAFAKLWAGLFQGQYNFAVDIYEARQFKLSMDEKYHPREWDAEKQYEFESSTGKQFSLNLPQIMSLYAYTKRGKQAIDHLVSGGFVFEDNTTVIVDEKGRKKSYIYEGASSYKLNEATLNGIINSLTAEQKAYVDEMQKYLSETMGAKGNEVSMRLYGIKMFKEQFYFPLRSSGAYMERAKEAEMKKQQGQINLVNSSFTHSVTPKAKNPIILAGFTDVWAEHCNEMSMYHSMVLPMEDFRKVYNYSTVHDENLESASVFQTIKDAYGKAATDYIDQLYKELNAGATVDPRETDFKKLISNFKKTAVMLSASVVVQQFSSIGRAYALIDPKYFIGTKVNSDTQLSVVEEMKKYAPVAIIKEMGGFDTGTKGNAKSYIMAETYSKGERLEGFKKDEQYRSDLMGILPAKADEKTWCAIWEAVKRETKEKHSDMDVKSEEFLKLAGERFSEVIEKTQVYDSVLARSANMRSKSAFMQMATSFMAEPTTTVNLIEDAIRSGNKNHIARTFGAVAVSIVLNNALASIVYAMRDDDEDETFVEKYFQSFTSGMIDDINPMSYYPFLKDVYSLFQGYDVERADMSVIADLRDALKKTVSLIGKDTSNMDDDELAEHNKTVNSALLSLLDAGCSVFGVPLKNVRRDAMGIINAWNTVGKDLTERDTSWNSFWDKVGAAAKDTIPIYAWIKDEAKTDKLYDAIVSGDKSYLGRLKSTYKTDDAYHTAVRKALRENDPRIREAALAEINGDPSERVRIAKLIKADGFDQDDVVMAINAEINKLTKTESDSGTTKVKGLYKTEDFVREYANGDMASLDAIQEDILDTAQKNGKTLEDAKKDFASDVRSKAKDVYLDGSLDDATAEKLLVEYADMDEEEAASKVSYWAFCEEHPGYDFTESQVAKYHEFAEPTDIPVDVYAKFISGTKGLADIKDEWGDVEVSKRNQVLEVIDSLPLTWEQKDALYLAAGYSENKIWDVPW